MSEQPLLTGALQDDRRATYRWSVRWRVLDGILSGVGTLMAFGALIWAAGGNAPAGLVTGLLIASLVVLAARYYAGVRAIDWGYATTFEAGANLRRRVLRHLTRLPLGAFQKLHAGKIAHTLSEDMMWLEQEDAYFKPGIFAEIATIACLFFGVLILHWPAALAAAVTWALGLLVIAKLRRNLAYGLRFRSDGMGEASRHFIEFAEGIQVIRAFGNTPVASRDFEKWIDLMREGFRKGIRRNTPIAALAQGLAMTSVGLGAVAAIATAPDGDSLLRVIGAIGLLTGTLIPARAIISGSSVLSIAEIGRQNVRAIERIDQISEGSVVAEPGPARIVFDDVAFSYDGEKQTLSGMSFTAEPGTITAIVGRSGSGKTTLANLLLRFWDCDSGTITLNGRNIRDFRIASYMDRFAAVFQDAMLFRDTVRNNIRVGKPDASDDEVIAAARAAQVHDVIENLDRGYDEVVGPGGQTLSGGERQRVTIARAILKNADIVILDEATSALDPENEREIQLAFEELARGKTVFIIAHRLSTIVEADNILLLDEGRLVAQGPHDRLMASEPLYQRLWERFRAISEWQI